MNLWNKMLIFNNKIFHVGAYGTIEKMYAAVREYRDSEIIAGRMSSFTVGDIDTILNLYQPMFKFNPTIPNPEIYSLRWSTDRGKTWQQFYEPSYAPLNLNPYTAAEYEKVLTDYKAAATGLVASAKYSREQIDITISTMEEELAKLQADNGKGEYVKYMPVFFEGSSVNDNGSTDTSSINITPASPYDGAIIIFPGMLIINDKLFYAEAYGKDLGEMLSAAKEYCGYEVKAGRMSQSYANEIVNRYTAEVLKCF